MTLWALWTCGLASSALSAALSAQESVCAHVEIQISQRVMATRTAFEATLLVNNETTDLFEDFLVEVQVENLAGNPASHLFAGLDLPTLSGFQNGGIDGTGDVLGNTSASIRWLLVPTEGAAPGADSVRYKVSGRVRHKQHGLEVEIPLYPVEIEVYPDAALFLDYYLQRIVYSDNPFTAAVEPAEPFALGLLIRNAGFGEARNLRITSSQPQITNNERQLLIAFEILGAQLGDAPINPSLAVDFGNLAPGSSSVARWLMSSSLQGRFTCIDVDFEHVTNFGSGAVSLIKDADIYWQTHTVELASAFLPPALAYLDDGLPDFLVEVDPNQPMPDTEAPPVCGGSGLGDVEEPREVHSSEGARLPVARVDPLQISTPRVPTFSDLSVPMTVTVHAPGWNYLRFEDPGRYNGLLANRGSDPEFDLVAFERRLEHKIRQIGKPPPTVHSHLVGDPGDIGNAWRTARKTPINQAPTTQESHAHLFEYFPEPGEYRFLLHYQVPPVTLTASESLVSLHNGATIRFEMNAGAANAGRAYELIGSTLEPLAGVLSGDVHYPLRPDAYTSAMLSGELDGYIRNRTGTLDGQGRALAQLIVPPRFKGLPAGTSFYHAFLVGGRPHDLASEPVKTLILP